MTNPSRRTTLKMAAATAAAAVAGAPAAAATSRAVRLVIAQQSWTTDSPAQDLGGMFAELAGPRDAGIATLLVLPPAIRNSKPPGADALIARLGAAAKNAGVFLAGSARMQQPSGAAEIGFLIGADGAVLLRAPKITPDVLGGFSDTGSAFDRPHAFPVARLPFGAVGLLVGEDLFRATHVRALAFNGAELILNPAAETADLGFAARRDAATSIAYCNMAYVAAATGAAPSRAGLWDWRGNAALAEGAPTMTAVIDVEELRVARQQGARHVAYASRTLPPMVRDGVYGPAFQAAAARRPRIAAPTTRAAWSAEAERRIAAQAVRATPAENVLPAYDAILMQTPHRVLPATGRKEAIAQNIRDFLAMAEPAARRPASKLVLFGEFAFTAAGYRTVEDALSVTLSWPGPELEQIAAFAAKHGVYVAAQQLEHDAKFPGRIFNTAFLFDATGKLAARHRKMQCVDLMGTLPDTTPGSIYDAYVAEYGADSLWQVIDTPLGKLAPMICFENMFAEGPQIYAQNGAEVYLHLTSEGWDAITETRYAWNTTRRLHALNASAYFLSVNQGDDPVLRDPYHVVGESQAIDPYGRVIGMLRESRPGVLVARVDLNLLRTARSDPRANLGIWDEPAVYADAYQRGLVVPNNQWSGDPAKFPYADLAAYRATVERFNQRGVYTPPDARGAL